MLVEKEVIRPGTYWYKDQTTGLPRKIVVTPELTKYWNEQGNKMLSLGLTVPVPCEHDFNIHPMSPAENLKNNAGWVKEYRLKGDALFSTVDVTDDEIRKKLPHTIRWTSPWINSFTDGAGREWKNVISHLALTTRPRVVPQAPFSGIAAALSLATEVKTDSLLAGTGTDAGFCLSRAGKISVLKKSRREVPRYPLAFSVWAGGIKLAEDDMPPPKDTDDDYEDSDTPPPSTDDGDMGGLMNPLQDQTGDVKMEELLCDLLNALGVQMPENVGESEFKRALYEATMSKIKELTAKGQGAGAADANGNTTSPAGGGNQNPLIQQEQQPMYMSLEDINKIADPTMKNIALSMYNENVKLRAEADADRKKLNSLNESKLKEENAKRQSRVALLGKVSPKVKADLEAMLALPAMALSMGDGGAVVDPMATTLAVLEKGLSDLPRLLTVDQAALSEHAHPKDADLLIDEKKQDEIADELARKMGCPPQKKAS